MVLDCMFYPRSYTSGNECLLSIDIRLISGGFNVHYVLELRDSTIFNSVLSRLLPTWICQNESYGPPAGDFLHDTGVY